MELNRTTTLADDVERAMLRDGLPSDPDAEAAVLAAVLTDPAAVAVAAEMVRASDFAPGDRRKIAAAALALHAERRPVDLVTVTARLADEGADVPAYVVTDAAVHAGRSGNVGFYAARVREKAILRDVAAEAAQIARRAATPGADPFDALDALRAAHDGIAGALPGRAMLSQADALAALDAYRASPNEGAAPCRLPALAMLLGGWKPGKLYVGGGRPAMGKSSHAKSEAVHVARSGRSVAVFTLEMSADEYAERTEDEAGRGEAAGLPIYYHDSPRLTAAEMRARLHRLRHETAANGHPPVGFVVVDYLQLMHGTGDNREQQVASLSRELKIMAREFSVPVLALAQLNREVEHRTGAAGKRPQLSDLRESGAIENDADAVLFYYRPAYYGAVEVEIGQGMQYAGNEVDSLCEIIVAKQRRGPTGSAWSRFHGPTTSFRSLDEPVPYAPGVRSPLPF